MSQDPWRPALLRPRHGPGQHSSGGCGPLADRLSAGAGGRVSAATSQSSRFEWELVRPAGGVPRECGSPLPMARRPRPSTLLLLPPGSSKAGRKERYASGKKRERLLTASYFLDFKEGSWLLTLLGFGAPPCPPPRRNIPSGCWRFPRNQYLGPAPERAHSPWVVLWEPQLPCGLRQNLPGHATLKKLATSQNGTTSVRRHLSPGLSQ